MYIEFYSFKNCFEAQSMTGTMTFRWGISKKLNLAITYTFLLFQFRSSAESKCSLHNGGLLHNGGCSKAKTDERIMDHYSHSNLDDKSKEIIKRYLLQQLQLTSPPKIKNNITIPKSLLKLMDSKIEKSKVKSELKPYIVPGILSEYYIFFLVSR